MTTGNTSVTNADLAVEKNNEGVSRFKAGDLAGAAKAFNESLEYDPSLDEARENRDMAIRRLGYDPLVEDRTEKSARASELEIDAGGDVLERMIQYGMYALAAVIGLGLMIFIWGILGWVGVGTLLGVAAIVWGIKWSWLILLR
jgi:hypothetical protein